MADEREEDDVDSEEKMSLKVTEYLDGAVGTNLTSLNKAQSLLNSALKKEKELKKRLDDSKHTTPVEVQEALDNGKSSIENIKDLQNQREVVLEKAESKVEKVKPLAEHLSHLADQIADIERFRTYISWIQKLEAVSTGIQENLEAGLLSSAVDQFSILAAVTKILESSSCDNLKTFSKEMQIFWRRLLMEKLSSEFDEVTKALRWPFTSLSTAPPLSTTSDVYKSLERLFLLLLKLQDFKMNDESSKGEMKEKEIPLPIDWLLKPLRKRFKFHFYGKKQTNNLEKPEWFFTQVLNWIRSHGDFIQHTVQLIFDKANLGYIDAKFEFIRGLLKITVDKMEHSLPLLLKDDTVFSHFVDETLLFQQEVHNLYDYPVSDNPCLNVLVIPKCLDKWVELEHRYAKENLKSLVTSSTAWKGKYQDVGGEVDETRTPECAEGFVTLLTVITDRYKDLPSHENQIRFLDVQLHLLKEFIHDHLYDMEKQYSNNPVDPTFLSVLNASHFMYYVLEDWTEQAIFLQLHELRLLRNSESDFSEESNSTGVFDHPIRELHTLKESMLQKIVENVIRDFRSTSTAYKKERWHSLPSPKDLAIMALSPGACELLLSLKDRLKKLERQLARALFSNLWQRLAQSLNKLIYEEIILECRYNEGGAAQLEFDMTKHLFTLFGEYTSKPENYFKEVKECCILLNQLPGSAFLIMETLNNGQSYIDDVNSSPKATLNELGVYRLTPKDALRVLKQRINWPKA